jgi:hypothetical protein
MNTLCRGMALLMEEKRVSWVISIPSAALAKEKVLSINF